MTDKGSVIVFRDLACSDQVANMLDHASDLCLFGEHLHVSLRDTLEEALNTSSLDGVSARGADTLEVRDVSQFALARIFFASLLLHPRRTLDPAEADLFFIPAFTASPGAGSELVGCPTAEQLVAELPHLSSETAARHFWLTPSTGWGPLVCEVFNSRLRSASPAEQLLARTTKLALEDRVSAPLRLIVDDLQGTRHRVGRHPPLEENLHSIPYAPASSGLSDAALQAWTAYITSPPRERDYLVSALWGFHGLGSAVDIRGSLTSQCKESPKCFFMDLDPLQGHGSAIHTEIVHAVKLRSIFCFEPTGDTPSRKGIVDSIVTGCIPVLFSSLQAQLWSWHVGHWEDVSILVEDTSQDVISLLANIPKAEVARLRSNMARLAPRLTFSEPGRPKPGDALETTLAGVLRVAAAAEAA